MDPKVPWNNRIWPGLTELGPSVWQAEAYYVSSLSASPATAVGQILFTMAKFCYTTVLICQGLGGPKEVVFICYWGEK